MKEYVNTINLGYFKGKQLFLMACKYINGNLALFLVTHNNIEFETITEYVKRPSKKLEYIYLNPNISEELINFLIKKKVIYNKFTRVEVEGNNYLVTIVYPKVLELLNIDKIREKLS